MAAYTTELARVITGSQLPPVAVVRQAEVSVTGFKSGGEHLHLVVSEFPGSLHLFFFFFGLTFQSYLGCILTDGMQLSGWYIFMYSPIIISELE